MNAELASLFGKQFLSIASKVKRRLLAVAQRWKNKKKGGLWLIYIRNLAKEELQYKYTKKQRTSDYPLILQQVFQHADKQITIAQDPQQVSEALGLGLAKLDYVP